MNARLPPIAWPEGVRRHGTHTPARGDATVAFTLDGQPALAREGESILHAAQRHGVAIPHLCHSNGLRPDGNCRACVVEVAGERVLAASCCRTVTPGMDVKAQSERALKSQRLVLELLAADMPHPEQAGELSDWLSQTGVTVRPALRHGAYGAALLSNFATGWSLFGLRFAAEFVRALAQHLQDHL